MKAILIALAIAATSTQAAAQPEQAFLSWYNGWTVHTVWGLGKVSGSYENATVKCGTTIVAVTPIYDTHADKSPPGPKQTESFAEASNLALLTKMEAFAGKCEFAPAEEA